MPRLTVLVVDDALDLRRALRIVLEAAGYAAVEADGVHSAVEAFRRERPDLVLLDHALGDGTAFDVLEALAQLGSQVPVIVLTGSGTIDIAVESMKRGVRDFLPKPVLPEVLLAAMERALAGPQLPEPPEPPSDPFAGTSEGIRALAVEATRAAASDDPLLIRGEPGTGKGVLARWIHDHGPRAGRPFTALSLAALPPEHLETELFGRERGNAPGARSARFGLVEATSGGTLFLDDVDEVDPALQGKLLALAAERRFRREGGVEDRRADVRVLAASSGDPRGRAQLLGVDLLAVLATRTLVIPPLHDRPEDIPALVSRLLSRLPSRSRKVSLAPAAIAALQSRPWPGNVRELRNVLERAVLNHQDRTLGPGELGLEPLDPLPPAVPAKVAAEAAPAAAAREAPTLRDAQRTLILQVLQDERFSVASAARRLGLPRSTLYQKVRELGLQLPRTRRCPATGGRS